MVLSRGAGLYLDRGHVELEGHFVADQHAARLERGVPEALVGSVAGASAFGLSIFPTTPEGGAHATGWVATAGALHLMFPTILFSLLAVFCLVLFIKSGSEPTKEKKIRNRIYQICGWLIVGCIVAAGVAGFALSTDIRAQWRPLFWLESVAVLAFGVSWVVKGEIAVPRPAPASSTSPACRSGHGMRHAELTRGALVEGAQGRHR